jgi:hypothetical protein
MAVDTECNNTDCLHFTVLFRVYRTKEEINQLKTRADDNTEANYSYTYAYLPRYLEQVFYESRWLKIIFFTLEIEGYELEIDTNFIRSSRFAQGSPHEISNAQEAQPGGTTSINIRMP